MAKILDLYQNFIKTLRLAMEIDGPLVVVYYATAFLYALVPVVASLVLKILIDNVVSKSYSQIGILLVGYFFIRLVEKITLGLNNSYYDYLLRNKMQMGLSLKYSHKLSSLDLGHLENPETQNLITKVRNTFAWQIPDFLRVWNYLFADIITIISSTILLAPYGIWIPTLIILITLPRVYFKAKHGNFAWAMYGGSAPEAKKLWYTESLLTDNDSILETRVFQSQNALLSKLQNIQQYLYDLNKKPLDQFRWVVIFAPVVEIGVVLGIIWSLIPGITAGLISIGSLSLIITSAERLKDGSVYGSLHLGELFEKSLFTAPFFELLAIKKIIHEKENAKSFEKIVPPLIEFKNVSFSYPNGHTVIDNISLVVKPGERIALVGPNGAGKTTLIKLLCRFYDVSSGQILINGVNLKDLKLANWYAHLGTLFQEFVKYNFTVKENIMLGSPSITDEDRMLKAAEKSGAIGFINDFPQKFNQVLGREFEEGEELSGGQWQKLAIARAFYEQAPVLIMDEPTSAIDAEAEYEIFQNLEKVYKGRTLILVSHRFSTVRNADKIFVLDQGKIIESGSHANLLKQKGKYASMFNTQAKGYA